MKLSLAIATHNEEQNIVDCIRSAQSIVDGIVVVDGASTDKTVEFATKEGARVILADNPSMFHINKQKAIDAAQGDWVLQLDADERVTPELAKEIKKIMEMDEEKLKEYEKNLPDRDLFLRHEMIISGKISEVNVESSESGNKGETPEVHGKDDYNAFFIPRLNYFLGKYLRYGGVYPDGVIRLLKKGKAYLPCKDVHELMKVEGKIGWLQNPLQHIDSPTFKRYLERNSRYINYTVEELKAESLKLKAQNNTKFQLSTLSFELTQFINWVIFKPISWFFMTTFRHKGILDGWQGVVFSFFSALRFPRAYIRYLVRK